MAKVRTFRQRWVGTQFRAHRPQESEPLAIVISKRTAAIGQVERVDVLRVRRARVELGRVARAAAISAQSTLGCDGRQAFLTFWNRAADLFARRHTAESNPTVPSLLHSPSNVIVISRQIFSSDRNTDTPRHHH